MKKRCKLYLVDGHAVLLLPDGAHRALPIQACHGDSHFQAFMRKYGVSQENWLKTCGRAINIAATEPDVERKEMHSLAWWDGTNLYVNCYEGSMVRISCQGEQAKLERVPVGTDGVLMRRFALERTTRARGHSRG